MRVVCLITKVTNTHSEHIILIALRLQQWLDEHASRLLCASDVVFLLFVPIHQPLDDCLTQVQSLQTSCAELINQAIRGASQTLQTSAISLQLKETSKFEGSVLSEHRSVVLDAIFIPSAVRPNSDPTDIFTMPQFFFLTA